MKLQIVDVNFTTKHDWLFKLTDNKHNEFYVMDTAFYRDNDLKSPVTKKELDSFDKGQWITAEVTEIAGKNVVLRFIYS